MNYLISANTDVGIKKPVNQDGLSVKRIQTRRGDIVFAILCDGLGGLSHGEVASSSVIKAYLGWVSSELPGLYEEENIDCKIKEQWESIMKTQNELLLDYGKQRNIRLGTTATIMLLTDHKYYIMNIGDTRAYQIDDQISQITQDHTLVAIEIKNGKLTEEQAKTDPRKNVLFQCIGVSNDIYPDMFVGNVTKDTVFLLCSDGFRNKVTVEELYEFLQPTVLKDANAMKSNINYLIELNKKRQETDNISAVTVRSY